MAQVLNTGFQRAGKGGGVAIGGTAASNFLAQSKWNCTYSGQDLDTTNFKSYLTTSNAGGATNFVGRTPGEGILGVEELSWGFGGAWDASANLLDPTNVTPPAVIPRDDLSALYLYLMNATSPAGGSGNVSTYWYMNYARVRSAQVGVDTRGLINYDASGMNQGWFLTPSGSIA